MNQLFVTVSDILKVWKDIVRNEFISHKKSRYPSRPRAYINTIILSVRHYISIMNTILIPTFKKFDEFCRYLAKAQNMSLSLRSVTLACARKSFRTKRKMVAPSDVRPTADRKRASPPHFAISRNGKERVGLQRVYPFCGRYQCAASLIDAWNAPATNPQWIGRESGGRCWLSIHHPRERWSFGSARGRCTRKFGI